MRDGDDWLEMSRRVQKQIDLVRAYADDPAHLSAVELSGSLSEHISPVDFEL